MYIYIAVRSGQTPYEKQDHDPPSHYLYEMREVRLPFYNLGTQLLTLDSCENCHFCGKIRELKFSKGLLMVIL